MLVTLQYYMSASSPISTVRPAFRAVFFPEEARAALAPVSGADVYRCVIDEFHSDNKKRRLMRRLLLFYMVECAEYQAVAW